MARRVKYHRMIDPVPPPPPEEVEKAKLVAADFVIRKGLGNDQLSVLLATLGIDGSVCSCQNMGCKLCVEPERTKCDRGHRLNVGNSHRSKGRNVCETCLEEDEKEN